jgi:hypothetical protein
MYYSATKHSAGQPVVAGWNFQWSAQFSWAHDSWTSPLDALRIKPNESGTDVTIAQVRRLVRLLGASDVAPMFVFDAGYDPIALGQGLTGAAAQVLVRISSKRVFYPDPGPRTGQRGRPRRHGARFCLSDPTTQTSPDAELVAHDPRYGDVKVSAWHGLHQRLNKRGEGN